MRDLRHAIPATPVRDPRDTTRCRFVRARRKEFNAAATLVERRYRGVLGRRLCGLRRVTKRVANMEDAFGFAPLSAAAWNGHATIARFPYFHLLLPLLLDRSKSRPRSPAALGN